MALLSWLWGREKSADAGRAKKPVTAPANGYDPHLVANLEADHKQLLAMYHRIGQLYTSGTYAEIPGQLVQFNTRLEGHLLAENFRFYTYLEEQLASDSGNAELMRDFRKEMNGLARVVMGLIRAYQSNGISAENATAFWGEYQKVGTAPGHRIEREEKNLFPMYTSPRR